MISKANVLVKQWAPGEITKWKPKAPRYTNGTFQALAASDTVSLCEKEGETTGLSLRLPQDLGDLIQGRKKPGQPPAVASLRGSRPHPRAAGELLRKQGSSLILSLLLNSRCPFSPGVSTAVPAVLAGSSWGWEGHSRRCSMQGSFLTAVKVAGPMVALLCPAQVGASLSPVALRRCSIGCV